MKDAQPRAIYLSDYQSPAWTVPEVELRFQLDPADTRVHARLVCQQQRAGAPLVLLGEQMELLSLRVNGVSLQAHEYQRTDSTLTLSPASAEVVIETEVRIRPEHNTALEGVYYSGGILCTQCEAEGFRRITYFPDRPDVLSRFTVTLEADAERFPVLLSNGNPIAAGGLADGRHWARWEDPFPKPCYLFALVAGALSSAQSTFTTQSGRAVDLQVWVHPKDLPKCDHALASLMRSMQWDEQRFGREYDLDVYNIVAVDDFNMGAMENKGLNIFNTKYVLASAETATDADFEHVEGVIGHEYFHNWSGNRVTLRDWFQLSLKEGLTVFRDQEFTSDLHSRAVKRIQDVRMLRDLQFSEDASAMAHPVRPDQYIEINNFYTATVYEKGSEVVRMLHTLLGEAAFRAGLDHYFAHHDGKAATIEDFIASLELASGRDLQGFMGWYRQPGTPRVHASWSQQGSMFELTLRQAPPSNVAVAEPLWIPVRMGLLDAQTGEPLGVCLSGAPMCEETVLELRAATQTWRFEVERPALPSLLRSFSAPVVLDAPYTRAERLLLLAHEHDGFNRWEAAQELFSDLLLERLASGANPPADMAALEDALRHLLHNLATQDPALLAEIFELPSEAWLAERIAVVDAEAVYQARQSFQLELASALRVELLETYFRFQQIPAQARDHASMGRRALRNQVLGWLLRVPGEEIEGLAVEQARSSNMTDVMGALRAVVDRDSAARDAAFAAFHQQWQSEALVLDKWFALQAGARRDDTLEQVATLYQHPDFTLANPNRARSLLSVFARNPRHFHRADGAGYRFVAEAIATLDARNPQIAARLAASFNGWHRHTKTCRAQAYAALQDLVSRPQLSRDVFEIVSRNLAAQDAG